MTGIWEKLEHFSYKEAWGDPDRMDHNFLCLLDLYRECVGTPFRVTCGYALDGHSPNSWHYKGRAVDGRFLDSHGHALCLGDQIALAMRSPFTGIGIYTHSANGPFLHFDNRPLEGERKVWVCTKPGVYQPLSQHFFKEQFV